MAETLAAAHRLWHIVEQTLEGQVTTPVVIRVLPNCIVKVTAEGPVPVVVVETERTEIPHSWESFSLNPDGSLDVRVSADIVSVLTQKVHVASNTAHYSLEDQGYKDILGFSRAREQMDVLADLLAEKLEKKATEDH